MSEMHKRDFGSFHSSNVDELISLTDDEYQPPVISIQLPCFTESETQEIKFGKDMRSKYFLLEDEFTFLNHGAFGAVLKPALQASQAWRKYMARQPVRFLDRELLPHMVYVTRRLAKFVGCEPTDLVLVPNVTMAMNCVLRSFPLQAGDEVLHFSTEYRANKTAISEICKDKGAAIHVQPISFPIKNNSQLIESLVAGLHENTRLVMMNHISSNTPFIWPIKQMVEICHSRGVPVLIDGAHALGQLDLDIRSLGADFYVSNCHKWLSACKGSALMYVAEQYHAQVHPLVISHGYASGFTSQFIWTGLQDYSPFLALHTVLDFWITSKPSRLREYMYTLARQAGEMLVKRWDTQLLVPPDMTGSMLCVQLPEALYADCEAVNYQEAEVIQNCLFNQFNIEVPIKSVDSRLYVRISVHIYNTIDDYLHLAQAIEVLVTQKPLQVLTTTQGEQTSKL